MTGFYVVMGVSGCGKSTVGKGLAQALGGTFIDGDDLHPKANIEKMSAGTPLTDEDRWPWLQAVGESLRQGEPPRVVACSALKRVYRDRIIAAAGLPVVFAHLHGSYAVLSDRMSKRDGHFMPTKLLDSQLATLEMPGTDERAVTLDIDQPPEALIAATVDAVTVIDR
ncbi:gluconate kinase, SKI family [Jannaschia faecimaris]|uniref:Gluconokinase n=1 Tax=Jannaschia faecimaris TaxID=1244108 RepID=A0A1H3TID4_9RHOB|nr:gluconokinase [Jannaschia faecimaris]SDZ50004.1 gluconate kinase, SKI family [Jannaschia faecimaris]